MRIFRSAFLLTFLVVLPCMAQSSSPFTQSTLLLKEELLSISPYEEQPGSFDARISTAITASENLNIEQLSTTYNIWQAANDVKVSGGYAFVAAGRSGLSVVDVSDPASPTVVADLDTPGQVLSVAVSGNYVYAADYDGGLRVIDVSTPTDPVEVASFMGVGQISFVEVDGNYAYVLYYQLGLVILDISTPSNPTSVGAYNFGEIATSVWEAEGKAYVTTLSGMYVLDVSNPTTPSLSDFYATSETARRVVTDGDRVYMAEGPYNSLTLHILDAANPDSLEQLSSITISGYSPKGLVKRDSLIYMSRSYGGVVAVNVSDDSNPVQFTSYSPPSSSVNNLTIAGNYLYATDGYEALHILDISEPTTISPVGKYRAGLINCSALSGSYLYVGHDYQGLRVVDVTDPTQPNEIALYDGVTRPLDVATAGAYAYVADYGTGLSILDISTPASPVQTGLWTGSTSVNAVTVSGDYAYVTNGSLLYVIDISSPSSPSTVGSYDTQTYANGVTVDSSYAYVIVGNSGLRIVDITNPTNPVAVGSFVTPSQAWDVEVDGDYAFVSTMSSGVRILDISDPTTPTEVSNYNCGAMEYNGISLGGNYLWVSLYRDGISVVDVSDPTNPVGVGYYDTAGIAYQFATSENIGYLSEQYYLSLYRFVAPAPPNSFSFSSPASGSVFHDQNVTVHWQPTTDPNPGDVVQFRVQWSTQPDFAIADSVTTSDTLVTLSTGLPDDSTIYWRVKAFDSQGDYVWGEDGNAWHFSIDVYDAPSAFTLLSPENADTCWTLDTTLVWGSSSDPDPYNTVCYDVWLDTLATLETKWQVADSIADTSLSISDLDDDQKYYWKVRATDTNTQGTWSSTTNYFRTYLPEAPTGFTYASPSNGAIFQSDTVAVTWHPASDPDPGDALEYQVQWSTDPEFASFASLVTTDTVANLTHDLPDDSTLYWRVKSYDTFGLDSWGEDSSAWNFNVNIYDTPLAFTLLDPSVGDTCWTLDTTLTWQQTTDPDPYDTPLFDVWLDTLADLSTAQLVADNVADTSYALTGLLDDHTYYWIVRATDSNTDGTWAGDTLSFNTYLTEAPAAFAFTSPDSGSTVGVAEPTVMWNPSSDPDPGDTFEYIVEWSTDASFSTSFSATTTDTFYTITDLASPAPSESATTALPEETRPRALRGKGNTSSPELTSDLDGPQLVLPDDHNYYWRVKAVDSFGLETAGEGGNAWAFKVDVQEGPALFALISPFDADTCWTLDTTLTWQQTTDPDPYDTPRFDVWLDTLANLSTAQLVADSVADTSYALTGLLDDHTYYWTVRATDSNTDGTWADDTLSFNTYLTEAPTPIFLVYPDSAGVVGQDTVVFEWTAATDPDPGDVWTYTLRWNHDGTWVDTSTTETSLQITELLDDLLYHWSVSVSDRFGNSVTSNSYETGWPFSTFFPEAPEPFALVGPADGTEIPHEDQFPFPFMWEESTDPDPGDSLTYTLELDTDSQFSAPLSFVADSPDSVAVDSLDRNTYYWRVKATDLYGLETYSSETWMLDVTLSVTEMFAGMPTEYSIAGLYPNPFNPTLSVVIGLPQAADLQVTVYNVMGRQVAELTSGRTQAGYQTFTFGGSHLSSGFYFVRASVPGKMNQVKKVVLMK